MGVSLTRGADRNNITELDLFNRVAGVELIGSKRNRIQSNTASGGVDGWGIFLEDADRNVIIDNFSRAHISDGIFLTDSDRNRIVKYEVASNFADGIRVTDGSDRNRVVANVAYNNDSSGIAVSGRSSKVVGNLVRDNLVFHNFLGIWIDERSIRTRVAGNETFDNPSDALRIEASGTRLIRNRTYDNGAWGIRSAPDVIAAGNIAFDNALGDCLNVTCRSD